MKILVVDDNKSAAEMMSDVLSMKGMDSHFITDPQEAIATIEKLRPDVVLLDIMMPGIDGITLCKRIKSNKETSNITVIMLTAKDFVEDKGKAKDAGAAGFINKTLTPNEVIKIINEIAIPQAGEAPYIKFWGTRGSIATPDIDNQIYGGDTACLELSIPGKMLIFDGGTGLRKLGDQIISGKVQPKNIYLFLSHYHWDHIQGLPFFAPAYTYIHNVNIYACKETDMEVDKLLETQMSFPYFPIPFKFISPNIKLHALGEEKLNFDDLHIKTIYMNHPGNALGFRIEYKNKAVVYMPDNEMNFAIPEYGEKIVDFCRNADILIHDAQYTPEEYKLKKSWGHSTQDDAMKLAIKANVKNFYLFHHDPARTDKQMDLIVDKCQKMGASAGSSVVCNGAKQGCKIEF